MIHRRAFLTTTAASLAGAAVAARAAAQPVPPTPPAAASAAAGPALPLPDLGVELVGVRLSGADFLIDLRYRIKDVSKAQPVVDRKVNPVLVNEATGDRYYVPQSPKIGQLRQTATSKQPAELGKVYFMLFANPDRRLKSGETVTLYVGDTVVKGIVVQ